MNNYISEGSFFYQKTVDIRIVLKKNQRHFRKQRKLPVFSKQSDGKISRCIPNNNASGKSTQVSQRKIKHKTHTIQSIFFLVSRTNAYATVLYIWNDILCRFFFFFFNATGESVPGSHVKTWPNEGNSPETG